MPRCLQETQSEIANADLVPVAYGNVLEAGLRLRTEVDLRAGALRELAVTRNEIRVEGRLDDVPDLQPSPAPFLAVDVAIAARIDAGRLPVGADGVGGLRETAEVELVEIHAVALHDSLS